MAFCQVRPVQYHLSYALLLISESRRISPQIVLKREIVESIANTDNEEWKERIKKHKEKYPKDPLPIIFNDPEPQLMISYHKDYPWHVQIHRDAFSYGEVGPKADPHVIVDLRFFGKSDVVETNKVVFPPQVRETDELATRRKRHLRNATGDGQFTFYNI